MIELIKKKINKKKYLLQYKFHIYGSNDAAIECSRKFEEEIVKLGRKYQKDIHIANVSTTELENNKMMYIELNIGRQLNDINFAEKINEAELTIKYFDNTHIEQKFIREKSEANDIRKHTTDLLDFIKQIFILLSAFNNDYNLSERIINEFEGDKKERLYFHINYFKLGDKELLYKDKVEISLDMLLKRKIPKGLDINFITAIYAESLYETDKTEKAERIVDIMKGQDSNNPTWYLSKAFLQLNKGNEQKGFEEYEKVRNKFLFQDVIDKVMIENTVKNISRAYIKTDKNILNLGIIYLSYYYKPDLFEESMAEEYLNQTNNKYIKRRIKEILTNSINKPL